MLRQSRFPHGASCLESEAAAALLEPGFFSPKAAGEIRCQALEAAMRERQGLVLDDVFGVLTEIGVCEEVIPDERLARLGRNMLIFGAPAARRAHPDAQHARRRDALLQGVELLVARDPVSVQRPAAA